MRTAIPAVQFPKPLYAALVYMLLIAAGLAGNMFPLNILNAHFIFGSIFALLALQLFGWGQGVLAALIISAYTLVAWNHPGAVITMTTEVAVVGWLFLRRKLTLVMADTLYWLLLGIPLGFLCFSLFTDLSAGGAIFLMAKQGLNGIANALAARLIFFGLARSMKLTRMPFRELVASLLVFFVLCPALLMLVIGSRADMADTDRRMRTLLLNETGRIGGNLDAWLADRRQALVHLAELAAVLPPEKLEARLELTCRSDAAFLQLALMDADDALVAVSPAVEQGDRGEGIAPAARPYLPLLRQYLRPLLSGVTTPAGFGRRKPVAVLLVPVTAGGAYAGAVVGALNLDRIEAVLKDHAQGSDMGYTLLDRNGRIIITDRSGRVPMTRFERGPGVMAPLAAELGQWIPPLPPHTSTIERWGRSVYVAEADSARPGEWKLLLEQPVAPYQKRLYERYIFNILMLFAILVAALFVAEGLSRLLVRSLTTLGHATRDLPSRLASGDRIGWPESAVVEIHHLVENIKAMSDELLVRLAESRGLNELLEQRVARRTEALEENQEFLAGIIENIPVMIFIKDAADLRFIKFNRTGEELLGYTREELLGKNDHDFFPKEEADSFTAKDREVLASGRLIDIPKEAVQTRHHGERIIHTKKLPLKDLQGRPRYLLGISEDITERIQAEKALLDANERLRLNQVALLNMMEDLKAEMAARQKNEAQLIQAQKMESVGRLAGGVAHDYNNILTVILGYGNLALDKVKPGEPLHDDLREIIKAAERSRDITRHLLAFARKQNIAPEMLDLNATVEGMLKMLRRLLGENISLAWLPRQDLWPVLMDPSQLDQILANLCVNARDAISDVGKITIETDQVRLDEDYAAAHPGFIPGEYVVLVVSDDGCGMDRATMDQIFEPFFTTKGIGEGTGLGLATVYGIVRQNQGFVNVYSEPGRGTTFRIYLPRYTGREGEAVSKGDQEEAPLGRGETLLVVEDDPSILKMTARLLEKWGYKVLTAGSPGVALQLAGEHGNEIDLLITDVVMPEMNGRDLTHRLQALHPGLRCLFMSGYTANIIAHHGVLEPGVHFIQKPFAYTELAIKIRAALA